RCLVATGRLLGNRGFHRLVGWIAKNTLLDLVRLPLRLVPTRFLPRYRDLPRDLRGAARFAERHLRRRRWVWLAANLWFQLELTRAQIPIQRFGKSIEHLVSMLVLCHHAAQQDETQQRVAALQCALLRDKFLGVRIVRDLWGMDRLRARVQAVGDGVERGKSSLLDGVEPQPFAHGWE